MKRLLFPLVVLTSSLLIASARAGSVSGSIRIDLNMTHTTTQTLSTAFETLPTLVNDSYTTGITTNQLNYIWYGRKVVVTNVWSTLDIVGGITDSFGQVAYMTKVRFLSIRASPSNTACVGIFGPVETPVLSFTFTTNDTVKLWPGETFCVTCPTHPAITNIDGVADVIGFTNFSGSVGATCDVYICGSNP